MRSSSQQAMRLRRLDARLHVQECGTLNFINEDEIRDNPTDVSCSTNDEDGSHLGAIVNPFNSASQQADTIGDIKSRHADGLSPSDSTVSSLNDENNDDEAEEGSAVHHDDNEGEANASYASNSESTRQDQASKFEGLSYDEGPSFKSLFLSLAFAILLVACMIACPDETFDVAKKLGDVFLAFFNLLTKALLIFPTWLSTLFAQ